MVPAFLLCCALLGAPTPEDRATYEAAKAQAGRDTDAHVKLALWCEQHGLNAERTKHLALAVLIDPKNAAARGLMGLVAFQGRWQRPEQVQADADLAAALAAYNGRRARMANTADAHWKMALWCEENGLKAEATAHLTAVTRLEPGREAAWKRLGCKKHNGRWMTEAQIDAEKDEIDAQKKADKLWKPLLTKWRGRLADKDKRAEAEALFEGVTDPRAVPSIWAVFVENGESGHARAVRLLGQIEAPASSRALAVLAVFSPLPQARRTATELLRNRDGRDFVGWLIALIRKPLKYDVRLVGGPGSPGVLFVENERFSVQRLYAPPPLPNIPLFPGEPITFDPAGLPVVSRFLGPGSSSTYSFRSATVSVAQYTGQAATDPATAEQIAMAKRNPASRVSNTRRAVNMNVVETATTPMESSVHIPIGQIVLQYQTAALVAEQQLENDILAVQQYNGSVKASNEEVVQVLRSVTGHDEGADQEAWTAWWTDQQGYVYRPPTSFPKPVIVENVPIAYTPAPVAITAETYQTGPTTTATTSVVASNQPFHSCFRAGTPVLTLLGPRPIESVRVGDRVLTEDTRTGVIAYEPVVAVYHNRPALTYGVSLGEETISATGIHRFWKAGHGWVMARDLKSGDPIRTLSGVVKVASVETETVQPVFNLEVASGQSFFVGKQGALVHDNSLVQPSPVPFDAAPELTRSPAAATSR